MLYGTRRNLGITIAVAGLMVVLALGIMRAQRYGLITLPGLTTESSAQEHALGLQKLTDIPFPGSGSRFYYQSLNPFTHRLYIARMGANRVAVVDLQTQQVVNEIPEVADVHGVLAVPQLGKVYATATGDNQVVAIDEGSLRITGRTAGGDYPDGLAYAPEAHKVFVSDEAGKTVAVIDARTNQRVATVDVGGDVGNTQYDPVSHAIFSAVHTRNQFVAIDPQQPRVTERYDLAGCQDPHGLYLEATEHLAFIACEGNAKLVVFDLVKHHITGTYTVGETPDVLAFDPGLHRLYVAAESGVLAVFTERGKSVEKLAQGFIADNAHTIAVDPQTHRVYLPLRNVGGHPVLRILEPIQKE
ncbi:MAG: YncE family protein [Actinomycetota bacterium]|nr:YncE family protein [Actinomycetota bacterium]